MITQQMPLLLDLDTIAPDRAVLVAEDSDDDFLLLRKAFGLAGLERHQLIRVRTGEATIMNLKGESPFDDRERWPLPDLLLLDGKMPGGSGFDVLRFLAENRMEIQVPAVVAFRLLRA